MSFEAERACVSVPALRTSSGHTAQHLIAQAERRIAALRDLLPARGQDATFLQAVEGELERLGTLSQKVDPEHDGNALLTDLQHLSRALARLVLLLRDQWSRTDHQVVVRRVEQARERLTALTARPTPSVAPPLPAPSRPHPPRNKRGSRKNAPA